MFSKSCEYAFRAVVYLCSRSSEDPIAKIKEISDAIKAPMHYTSKVLQQLSRKGIIGSQKGPNGGFYVDGRFTNTKLIEIVKVIDGEKIFTGCAMGIMPCSETNPCVLHERFKKIRNELNEMMQDITIHQLADGLHSGELKMKLY